MSSANSAWFQSPAGKAAAAAADARARLTETGAYAQPKTVPGHWEPVAGSKTGSSSLTTTTTTVKTSKFDNGVVDISIIPYMRHLLVHFNARGLRPNRRVWFYFDDVDITSYIVRPDIARLAENSNVAVLNSRQTTNTSLFSVGSGLANVATILQYGRHFDFSNANTTLHDTGNTRDRKRKLKLNKISGILTPGQGHTIQAGGITGILEDFEVFGHQNLASWFSSSTSNTIVLPSKTKVLANNYWGTNGANTITFHPNRHLNHPPLTANIVGFNNVTQTLTLSSTGTLANLVPTSAGDPVTINTSPSGISWTIGSGFYTDDEGQIAGTFAIPAGKFRTGERIFRIIDNNNNSVDDASTYADYKFDATGLQQTKASVTIQTTSGSTTTTEQPTQRWVPEHKSPDPIAQTFFVNAVEFPDGVFATSLDLFFRSKDEIIPVTVELRPTINGYPSNDQILGSASVLSEHVRISEDASVATNFKFSSPIYLPPGEHAIVVRTDSLNYEVFVSQLGQKIIGTNRIVSAQPYTGSFFKSQNASTWDAIQLEDLTFILYKAVFSSSGSAILATEQPEQDVPADYMLVHMNDRVTTNTAIGYTVSYPGVTNQVYDLDIDIVPSSRITYSNTGATFNVSASFTTQNPDISPVLYYSTGKVITIQNYIDNANLAQSDFMIVKPLGGFPANANVALTITSQAGSGAVAFANANASGFITSIILAADGSGYTDNVTASIGTNTSFIKVASETNDSGGPALAKYISRHVVLAEGFDANDLKVFLTAYKPPGTDIQVYYKVRSINDPEPFERKNWFQMYTDNPTYSYEGGFKYSALEYQYVVPGTEQMLTGITYTSGSATYTYFNEFAIKLVLLSNDTTKYPVIYDMRAIALPL